MPNASRYLQAGYTYHLTHRCHDNRFLLRTIRERNDYRKWLREGSIRYKVPIYNYCITSNHTHVIAHVENPEAVSAMMQLASATVARHWNRLKLHEGSFWEHPFRCTIIQDGRHLLNGLRYVSMNMVRAGVVERPSEWRWCGDDELMGRRSRYRMLWIERMLQSLDMPSMEAFQRLYSEGIRELLERRASLREAVWTEALAVGDKPFIEHVATSFGQRRRFSYSDVPGAEPNTFCVREDQWVYS